MSGRKKYPYQNLSLTDIPGEKWNDIPGFEDEYQLSSFGRLKSQGRWIDFGKYDSYRPERIKKLKANKNNKHIDLSMQLHKHGKRYRLSVARYVYYLFIAPFNLEDHTVIISRKDGDILNTHYKNLVLKTISDVAKDGFATNKRRSQFQLQAKPVTQYDSRGNKLAHFSNAVQASAATGVTSNYINDAARTLKRTAGGYYWRYGKSKSKINILKLKKAKNESLPVDTPHYLNRNIIDIPNEKWNPVKGYEGNYEISDHGRVRSLSCLKKLITKHGNHASFWTKELIMKQSMNKSSNRSNNNQWIYLKVGLNKEGVSAFYLVSRLVYEAFGKKKELLAERQVVHKDGNNFNNHISNLCLSARSETIKNSYSVKNRTSYFVGLTKKQRRKYTLKAAKVNKKPVIQYDLAGKRISKFDSQQAAAKAAGVGPSTLSNALNGRLRTAGGFIWGKAKK